MFIAMEVNWIHITRNLTLSFGAYIKPDCYKLHCYSRNCGRSAGVKNSASSLAANNASNQQADHQCKVSVRKETGWRRSESARHSYLGDSQHAKERWMTGVQPLQLHPHLKAIPALRERLVLPGKYRPQTGLSDQTAL